MLDVERKMMESEWGASATPLSELLRNGSSGIWLEWNDLCVDVDIGGGFLRKKAEKKRIVHESRGKARPGQVLAVMGPSGAGKTSLFNSLAMRGSGYSVSGTQTINGLPYTKEQLGHVGGFVFQEAMFHSFIKVEEALLLAADLKLPRVLSREEKKRRVEVLLDAFDLRKCAQTRVGDSKVKGISGGEKKRLSIAIEALTGPSVLFLDEPTTGLDAASSLMVVMLLSELARSGTTVVMVLHQPRTTILRYVDMYLILSEGRDIFYGDMTSMLFFFEHVGMPIPMRSNPLDFVLDLINTNEAMDELISAPRVGEHARTFAQVLRGNMDAPLTLNSAKQVDKGSELVFNFSGFGSRRELAQVLSEKYRESRLYEELCSRDPLVMTRMNYSQYEGSMFHVRAGALLRREFLQKSRNPEVLVTQICGAIVLALVIGSIYWQTSAVFNQTALISFAGMMAIFLDFHLILHFPLERLIFLRDRDNGLYSSAEYYFSSVLAGMPGDIVASFLLGTILYWMVGLRPNAGAFFTFCGFVLLINACGAAMLYFSGAIAPSPSTANSMASLVLLFALVFNGFFIAYNSIPVWYRWIADINFMRFALSVMCFNQFVGQDYNCTPGVSPGCAYSTGSQALIALGIPLDLEVWRMAIYVLIIWFIFHILAFLAVTFCYTGYASELRKGHQEKKKERKLTAV